MPTIPTETDRANIEPIEGTEKFLATLRAIGADSAREALCGKRTKEIFDAVQKRPRHISGAEFAILFAEHRVYALEHGCVTAVRALLQQKQVLVPKPNSYPHPNSGHFEIDPECLQIPWGHQIDPGGSYRWLFAPANVQTVKSQATLYKDRNPQDRRQTAYYVYLGQKPSANEGHPLVGDPEAIEQMEELFQINRTALDALLKKTKRGKEHAGTADVQWPHFQTNGELGVLNSAFTSSMCYLPLHPPSKRRRAK